MSCVSKIAPILIPSRPKMPPMGPAGPAGRAGPAKCRGRGAPYMLQQSVACRLGGFECSGSRCLVAIESGWRVHWRRLTMRYLPAQYPLLTLEHVAGLQSHSRWTSRS